MTCELAREAGLGNIVKVEVIGDEKTLFPDNEATLEASKILIKEGFHVLPYCTDDVVLCKKLEAAGCTVVMPLAAPIGSGLGIRNPYNIKLILQAVNVTVLEFFLGRLAHGGDFDFEIEFLIGQGVITVGGYGVSINFRDFKNHGSIGRLRLETHADRDFTVGLKRAFRNLLHHIVATFSVAFFGRNLHLQLDADILACQFLLQAWDDISGAVEVLKRVFPLGAVDGFTVRAGQGVVHSDDGV